MICLSRECEALARQLADVERLSVEDTVLRALEERARAAGVVPARPNGDDPVALDERRRRGEAILDRVAAMPIRDPRPIGEIVDDLNAL